MTKIAFFLASILVFASLSAPLRADLQPRMVKDINPFADTGISEMIGIGDTLFFVASDGTSGEELWKSDGSEAGTVQIKDINPGINGSLPRSLINVNGELFFYAKKSTFSGHQLWKSDGTPEGTIQLTPDDTVVYEPLLSPTFINNPKIGYLHASVGNLYYFPAGGSWGVSLWISDGTIDGTKPIELGTVSLGFPGNFHELNGKLIFSAWSSDSSTGEYSYSQLWVSDGTPSGTLPITDPIPQPAQNPRPTWSHIFKGEMYYSAFGAGGQELWKTDGTSFGTKRVADINLGLGGSNPHSFQTLNDELIFIASASGSGKYDLWKTDGTESGTVMVKKSVSNIKAPLKATIDAVYYADHYGLWRTDGTPEGTMQVKFPFKFGVKDLISAKNLLFFTAWDVDNIYGQELWFSNGTEQGTNIVSDINTAGSAFSHIKLSTMEYTSNKLFFEANDGIYGRELWVLELNQDDDLDCASTYSELLAGTKTDDPDTDGGGIMDGIDPEPLTLNSNDTACTADQGAVIIDRVFSAGATYYCINNTSITTHGSIQIQPGARTHFISPLISLGPGFHVADGGIFTTAYCNDIEQ